MSNSADYIWSQWATGFTVGLRVQPEYHFAGFKNQFYIGLSVGINQMVLIQEGKVY